MLHVYCFPMGSQHVGGLLCLVSRLALLTRLPAAILAWIDEQDRSEDAVQLPLTQPFVHAIEQRLRASAKNTVNLCGREFVIDWSAITTQPVTDLPLLIDGAHALVLVELVCRVLHEQRLLVTSANPIQLHAFLEGVRTFIWPLQWSHPFLPLLPTHLHTLLESPTPFLFGVCLRNCGDPHVSVNNDDHDDNYEDDVASVHRIDLDARDRGDGSGIDNDNDGCGDGEYCSLTKLPTHVKARLVTELSSGVSPAVVWRHFLRDALHGYRQHILFESGTRPFFQVDAFLKTRCGAECERDWIPFLTGLLSTQLFQDFIDGHLEQASPMDDDGTVGDGYLFSRHPMTFGPLQFSKQWQHIIQSKRTSASMSTPSSNYDGGGDSSGCGDDERRSLFATQIQQLLDGDGDLGPCVRIAIDVLRAAKSATARESLLDTFVATHCTLSTAHAFESVCMLVNLWIELCCERRDWRAIARLVDAGLLLRHPDDCCQTVEHFIDFERLLRPELALTSFWEHWMRTSAASLETRCYILHKLRQHKASSDFMTSLVETQAQNESDHRQTLLLLCACDD